MGTQSCTMRSLKNRFSPLRSTSGIYHSMGLLVKKQTYRMYSRISGRISLKSGHLIVMAWGRLKSHLLKFKHGCLALALSCQGGKYRCCGNVQKYGYLRNMKRKNLTLYLPGIARHLRKLWPSVGNLLQNHSREWGGKTKNNVC